MMPPASFESHRAMFIALLFSTLFFLPGILMAEETKHVRKPLPDAATIAKLPKDGGKEFNRLVFETSPYLRQHARNPVNWYPWGEEAFALAKKENKCVFLSVGYSACHWCHVMEHESFEDEETAAYMNKHFINVKVDREERPDIDEIYMNATQIMVQRGGWPNSVWMTPEKKPWFCGTYFPKEDMVGRPSFMNVLSQLNGFWKDEPDRVNKQAEQIAEVLDRMSYEDVRPSGPIDPNLANEFMPMLWAEFDAANGGFGDAPKFPPHQPLALMLYQYERAPGADPNLEKMLRTTLDKMALGGIRDHVGGGFHRYATDAVWFLPHFEKMLYDNGQLGKVYVDAYRLFKEDTYKHVAEGIFDWVLRDMRDPKGGFYAALDADSEGEEGLFYLWTAAEVDELLGKDAATFRAMYQVPDDGNYYEESTRQRTNQSIPHLKTFPGPADQKRFDQQLETLREVRAKRIWPGLDDKVMVNWNGLMISALAYGGKHLERPDYLRAAEEAATFILTTMRPKGDAGRLLHTYSQGEARLNGYLDDYAFFANGLVDLFEATGKATWEKEARGVMAKMNQLFWDEEHGGYFFTSTDHEDLLARSKDPFDNATPSGNGIAALAQARLGLLKGDDKLLEKPLAVLGLYHHLLPRSPRAGASLIRSLALLADNGGIPKERQAKPSKALAKAGEAEVIVEVYGETKVPADKAFKLSARFVLEKGWHINPRKPTFDYQIPTLLALPVDGAFELLSTEWPKPKKVTAPGVDGAFDTLEGTFDVVCKVRLRKGVAPGEHDFLLNASWQACDDKGVCLFPQEHVLPVKLTVGGE